MLCPCVVLDVACILYCTSHEFVNAYQILDDLKSMLFTQVDKCCSLGKKMSVVLTETVRASVSFVK